MTEKRIYLVFFILIFLLTGCKGDQTQSSSSAEPLTQTQAKANSQQKNLQQQQQKQQQTIPESLKSQRWLNHFKDDLLPYWISPEAKGEPQGNFPTFRGVDGRLITEVSENHDPTVRYPRMLARQVYFYSVGYLLTGDVTLLQLAKDGCDWLIAHALDKKHGGWYAILHKDGTPLPNEVKYAQDTSYVAQAFSAYYFVTRDKEIEHYLLQTRDWIFTSFWDEKNKRAFDGLSTDMKTEIDQGEDQGWELVAQLDQINAYMMLAQPVLSEPARRVQFLSDMKTLADTMVTHFLADGIFWGIHNNQGKFGTRHVDFGHTLKAYWMLYQLDKRLPGHPYRDIVERNVHNWLELALDKENGTWGDKMLKDDSGKLYAQYGSLWWSYAELDQIAATLNFSSRQYSETLTRTTGHWLTDFVDKQYKEVYFGIKRDGSKGYEWKVDDIMKCFSWKNAFHSAEHALVMYIHGNVLEKTPVVLYFAVPRETVDTFIAKPYIFDAKELQRKPKETITIDKKELQKVEVFFQDIG